MATSPFQESRKLVHCTVTNRAGDSSARLIEIDAYKLWEYLMTTKHQMQISDPALCLWISKQEFEEHARIFEQGGAPEPVNRIVVDLFDADYGFSHTTERYAPAAESEHLIDILKSHIPGHLRDTDAVNIETVEGYIVGQWQTGSAGPLTMALER